MGVRYKISDKVINYIVHSKQAKPVLTCRQIAALATKKFKLKISKSSVNAILKQVGLSSIPGRKSLDINNVPDDIMDKAPPSKVSGGSIPVDKAGGIFLAAADSELGLTLWLTERLFAQMSARKMRKIMIKMRTWIYLPLFDITIDKLKSYDKIGLWEMAGGEVGPGELSSFIAQSSKEYPIDENIKKLTTLDYDQAGYMHFGLFDGSVFYFDAQFKALWPSTDIPRNLCATPYKAEDSITKAFIESYEPIILLCLGGYEAGKDIGSGVINFILSCQGTEAKNISRILVYGQSAQEVKKLAYVPDKKRSFMFGLFANQVKKHKVKLDPSIRKLTVLDSQGEKDYFVQDGQITISQHTVKQEVILRVCLIKSSSKARHGIVVVTNISLQDRPVEDIARLYLARWPDPEDSFAKINLKKDFSPEEKGSIYYNYSNLNKLDDIFPLILNNLSNYVCFRYFPSQYSSRSFAQMKRAIYDLDGHIKQEKGLFLLKLSYDYDQTEGAALLEDLVFAVKQVNENNLSFNGKRLILQLKPGKQ